MVGFLDCKRTLLAHVELLINQHPQVLLLRASLNPVVSTINVLSYAFAPLQWRSAELAIGLKLYLSVLALWMSK